MSNDEETGSSPPACDAIQRHVIPTERIGALNVWVHGDLDLARNKETRDSYCVFLTVHDIGVNYNSWLRFVNSAPMAQIRERSIFVHVDLQGQEDGAEDMTGNFPSMQEIGEDLVNILDTLRIKCVVGLGEGAGANIMLRFGMMHVTRCLGIVCINPNQTANSFMDGIMDRMKKMKIVSSADKPKTAAQKQMNQKNVAKYMDAFNNRSDIMTMVENKLKCDTLLVAGAKAEAHVKGMENLFAISDKTKTSMLKLDDVGGLLMDEAPSKLANAILLFVKGLGWLSSVTLPNVERRSSKDGGGRKMSMEEFDKPNIRRLSLTK